MPSFDIVSELDLAEVKNAVENSSRELTTRWDFKNILATFEFNEKNLLIKVMSESDFQVKQLIDILKDKFLKRDLDPNSLEIPEHIHHSGKHYSVEMSLKQGIDAAMAKRLIKLIKDEKLKVQALIQGEQVRVTGKSRDDLQEVIALVKNAHFEQPFQFINFRD